MEEFILIVLLIFAFVGIPICLGLLFYFVPKKLGYPKAAKYLTWIFIFACLLLFFGAVFEDELFTKNDARDLIQEQKFTLQDKFDILKNNSSFAIGDYRHTFTLRISERDKLNAISKIKSAENFKFDNEDTISLRFQLGSFDPYFGKIVTQNYETENDYVHEYFQPSGQKGYAPVYRRILISKKRNELIFEDIDE